jgi:hypothetical protein
LKNTVLIVPVKNRKSTECDIWGNLRIPPTQVIEERHEENYIKIFLYQNSDTFLYGYQIKVGSLLRQKTANITNKGYKTIDLARLYAENEIKTICNGNKTARKVFAEFIKIRYNHPELF